MAPLADRLDLRRAPRHQRARSATSTRRATVLEQGPAAQGARPPRDRRRGGADLRGAHPGGHRGGGAGRWRSPSSSATRCCGPARRRGLRLAHDRRRAGSREGFAHAGARVRGRRPPAALRSSPGWASNMRGQLTWGLGAPDEAQAVLRAPAAACRTSATTSYRQEIADGVGRCHVVARRARRGARAAARRQAGVDHPRAAAADRPLGRALGRGRGARRADPRDEPPHRQPLGRVGVAPPRARACTTCAATSSARQRPARARR